MDWGLWRRRALLSATLLAGSVYFISVHVGMHLVLLLGLGLLDDYDLLSNVFGDPTLSLAAAFQFNVWYLRLLFNRARAERARVQKWRLVPPQLDMV